LTLSVFESESDKKYKNKYDIGDIRPYLIRFHPGINLSTWNNKRENVSITKSTSTAYCPFISKNI